MRQQALSLLVLVLLALTPLAEGGDPEAFWRFMGEVDKLSEKGDFEGGIAALENALPLFPERGFEISLELAWVHSEAGHHSQTMAIWKRGHQEGRFFGLSSFRRHWKAFEEYPEFDAIVERDRELQEQAQATTRMRYEVATPEGYSPDDRYPLFIVLHGGGDSLERARSYWTSPVLRRDFIVAYVQSANRISSRTYGWPSGDDRAREGIRRFYDEIVAAYPVDTSRVLVGGMSAGGMMALDVALENVVPVSGVVVNCPVVPRTYEPPMAADLARRGVRVAVITGEKDCGLERQQAMAADLREAGADHELTVIPEMGHALPLDLSARLDAALSGPAGNGLQVTYIVNEGFVVESGGKRILLDALLSERFLDRYGVPELSARMKAAEPPFDDIDLLLDPPARRPLRRRDGGRPPQDKPERHPRRHTPGRRGDSPDRRLRRDPGPRAGLAPRARPG